MIRAGEAQAADLIKGYREHLGVPGLFGFAVQYHPELSWQDLARLGQYPNAQVSIGEDNDLRAALKRLGYDMNLVAGAMLTQLPIPVAERLHETFQQVPNAFRVRPRRTP